MAIYSSVVAIRGTRPPRPPPHQQTPAQLRYTSHLDNLPEFNPATTTRSNRGFELSPRLRSSKTVIRNRLRGGPRDRDDVQLSFTDTAEPIGSKGLVQFRYSVPDLSKRSIPRKRTSN